MGNKEYLNEEKYQKTNRKVRKIGLTLLIIGGIVFLTCSILIFGNLIDNFGLEGIIGFIWILAFTATGCGAMLLSVSYDREISAYEVQQQMPIVKESIEKMAPTYGVATKEIAKGIKEGLNDDEKK